MLSSLLSTVQKRWHAYGHFCEDNFCNFSNNYSLIGHNYLHIHNIKTSQTPLACWRDSFPMKYHPVLYTLYSSCASQINNIPMLVTTVTHIFPPKWFPWHPKSCDLSRISLLMRIPKIWWRLGLKWQNYSHKLLYSIKLSVKNGNVALTYLWIKLL